MQHLDGCERLTRSHVALWKVVKAATWPSTAAGCINKRPRSATSQIGREPPTKTPQYCLDSPAKTQDN